VIQFIWFFIPDLNIIESPNSKINFSAFESQHKSKRDGNLPNLIQRPIDIPLEGALTDLLWADPSVEHSGFQPSPRGTSFTFGLDAVHLCLEVHDFELIVRGHQVVPSGFAFPFSTKLLWAIR
jgi:diadenosine tetraphosphatase ApaH/serine/threonine PP2A family protein phosphatase